MTARLGNALLWASTMSDEDLRRAAFHEAGHAVVARSFGLPVGDHLEIADDGSGKTKIGSADHLPLIDQVAVRIAGVAAQDLFGLPKPRAGYTDQGKIIGLVEAPALGGWPSNGRNFDALTAWIQQRPAD